MILTDTRGWICYLCEVVAKLPQPKAFEEKAKRRRKRLDGHISEEWASS